jgi:hypothetical protein
MPDMSPKGSDGQIGFDLDSWFGTVENWIQTHLRPIGWGLFFISVVCLVLWLVTVMVFPATDVKRERISVRLNEQQNVVVDYPARFLADDVERPIYLTTDVRDPVSVTLELPSSLPLILVSAKPDSAVKVQDPTSGIVEVAWPTPSPTTVLTTTSTSAPTPSPPTPTNTTPPPMLVPVLSQPNTIAVHFKNAGTLRGMPFVAGFAKASLNIKSDSGAIAIVPLEIETTDQASLRSFAKNYSFLALLPFLLSAFGLLTKTYIDYQKNKKADANQALEELLQAIAREDETKIQRNEKILKQNTKYVPPDDLNQVERILRFSRGEIVSPINPEEFRSQPEAWVGALCLAAGNLLQSNAQSTATQPANQVSNGQTPSATSNQEDLSPAAPPVAQEVDERLRQATPAQEDLSPAAPPVAQEVDERLPQATPAQEDPTPAAPGRKELRQVEIELYRYVRIFPVDLVSPEAEVRLRELRKKMGFPTPQTHDWPKPADVPTDYPKQPLTHLKELGLFPCETGSALEEIGYLFSEKAWYWREHPLHEKLKTNLQPTLICGDAGSGRTALALALTRYAKYEERVLSSYHSASVSFTESQTAISGELLEFICQRSTWLSDLTRDDRNLLATVLLSGLDEHVVLLALSDANTAQFTANSESDKANVPLWQGQAQVESRLLVDSVKRMTGKPPLPGQQWVNALSRCAAKLGFKQVRIALDLTAEDFHRWRCNHLAQFRTALPIGPSFPVQLIVLVPGSVTDFDGYKHGLVLRQLQWNDATPNAGTTSLWKMLRHRYDRFTIDGIPNIEDRIPKEVWHELCNVAQHNPCHLAMLWNWITARFPDSTQVTTDIVEQTRTNWSNHESTG